MNAVLSPSGVMVTYFPLCLGEPDSPVLSTNEMKVEGNSFSVPVRQIDDGGSSLLHYDVRYKQVQLHVNHSVYTSIILLPV